MTHIQGADRSQTLLLPEAVDDFVGTDNPVRFIDAFVDELDLEEQGFHRVIGAVTGRPGYHPGDMLKLYIYGYLNRIRSSRRLEAECHRNLEVMWLMRRLQPDFKTIADFRKDNRSAFKKVFREFVILCRKLDLFGRKLIAVDGTRIKAVNNKDRNFTKASLAKLIEQSDERLEKYLIQLDQGDDGDDAPPPGGGSNDNLKMKIAAIRQKRDRLKGYLTGLEESGESQLSLTDPDARAMARMTKVGVGYNAQIAVDSKHKLIVEQEVYSNVLDYGLLTETAKVAKDNMNVETIDVVADRGYFQAEDIEGCETAGMIPYVPKPDRGPSKRDHLFPKEAFSYQAESDSYLCPGGYHLRFRGKRPLRDTTVSIYTGYNVCRYCSIKSKCTKSAFRQISHYQNEAVLEQMAARLEAKPQMLDRRRESVEHPFGTMKFWMEQSTFLMRRLDNVRGEFSLTALAYNIRRAINLVGVGGLIKAVRT